MDNRKRLLLKLRKLKLRRRALLLSYKMRLHFIYSNIFYETSGRRSNQSNTANEQKEQSKTAENQWTTWGQTTTFTTICKLAQIKQGNHCEKTVQPIKPCTVSAWKKDHFYLRAQKFTKEILGASEFGRARSYLTAPNLRHFRRDQILEVKTEMPETPIDRPL